MIKVIQLIDSLDTGGAEVLAVNIANSLSEENTIESHLCVTRKEGLLKERVSKNVNYLFLEKKKIFDFSAIFKLKKHIIENNISIIHAHTTSSFIAFCVKILFTKVKIVWHNHTGNYIKLSWTKLLILKIQSISFSQIINVNSYLNKWAIETLKFRKSIYLSNFSLLNNSGEKTQLKGQEGKRILHLAGLRKEKDHLNLLKAFKNTLNNHTEWTLHLVGEIYNDDYSLSIKNYIDKNNLQNAIFIYGAKSDIKYILSQATIGVLSSKSEGLPVSLLEYGLAKLPVLVTNVGECSKVVTNNNALVAPMNSTLFSKKLNKIIEDESFQNEISISLNKKVNEDFSKESFINKLLSIYKNIC